MVEIDEEEVHVMAETHVFPIEVIENLNFSGNGLNLISTCFN